MSREGRGGSIDRNHSHLEIIDLECHFGTLSWKNWDRFSCAVRVKGVGIDKNFPGHSLYLAVRMLTELVGKVDIKRKSPKDTQR